MRWVVLLIIVIVGLAAVFSYTQISPVKHTDNNVPDAQVTGLPVEVLAENLDTPWAVGFLPDGKLLVTERPGNLRVINQGGTQSIRIEGVVEVGEGGLLGLAVDPEYSLNNNIYLYFTYFGGGERTLNRVVKYKLENNSLSERIVLVDNIPGAKNHNGGRIKFGPDGYLYITTGDASNPSLSQDKNSLAGKILRITKDGKPAPGNPFNNLTYSFGHRNPQGLAWDNTGRLWETEHGPNALDEVNLIEIGKNYGWPLVTGGQQRLGLEKPLINSGSDTWAPAGAAFMGSKLFFGGLKGEALYILDTNNLTLEQRFKGEFGRIREVVLGPDGKLYIATSNKDGRGNPSEGDDKVVKIDAVVK